MTIATRVGGTLQHQIAALRREFADWRARTEERQPLEKHHTQVRRVTQRIEAGLLARAEAAADEDPFVANERARTVVRGAHALWDYFRSKLALRDVAWLRDELISIDELAWACYEPALRQAGIAGVVDRERIKEPPLVFFSPDVTPFARTRGRLFVAGGIDSTAGELFDTALLALPISVVGLPWFQLNHLPGAVVVAHEVGHAVANDLSAAMAAAGRPAQAIRPEIEAAIQALPLGARGPAWLAWCHELFADSYAVLCCGAAAALGLADYLAGPPDDLRDERLPEARDGAGDWGRYPTRALRMRFNFELLNQLGLPDAGLRTEWERAYGSSHALPAFDADLALVAAALLGTPLSVFGGKPIAEVMTFRAADHDTALAVAQQLLELQRPPKNRSFRLLFAAIALAYRSQPDRFVTAYTKANPPLAARLRGTIDKGVRSASQVLTAAPAGGATAAQLADELFALISSAER